MNHTEDENFKRNWEKVAEENQQMDSQTDERIRAGIQRKIKSVNKFKKLYWVAAAAVITGFGILFYMLSSPASVEKAQSQFYSSVDFTKKISLPDGSNIVLEPHSTLKLAKDFGKTDRKITFTGKATFDIAKDKTRPFKINAKDFTVQVLGTKFFLDQTSGKEKVELFEGKVKVNHQGKITYLLPNESWNKNMEEKPQTYIVANVKRNFSFEDENFENIIQELEVVYNVKIDYPQEYARKKIKGSFSGDMSEVLFAICYPFNLKAEKKSDNQLQLK
ncbi:FecR family protein [Epilithonimonas arachidiradicis]|uniref:Anti-sigma factor n=1 Tax=Epilithonimonas arachidiradicis TaxID=1617282 RepID=A0A420CM24_9FLAO|nr:FecR family protein [Epilithonimonas arachidiradicis]RKE79580.1 FecR family protein [Epilithonimonas arachidiradicis]GGG66305.1 anti-sigma factor [Epilithonimonas arachidiradicis]